MPNELKSSPRHSWDSATDIYNYFGEFGACRRRSGHPLYVISPCPLKPNGLKLIEYGTHRVLPCGSQSAAFIPQGSDKHEEKDGLGEGFSSL
jgi:hypothetical protein